MNETEYQPTKATVISEHSLGIWKEVSEKELEPDERVVVYFIRHAQAEVSPAAKSYPDTTPLSETGREAARQAGGTFTELVKPGECIRLASNLMGRTHQTALEIETGLKQEAGESVKVYSRKAPLLLKGLQFSPNSAIRQRMRQTELTVSGAGIDHWLTSVDRGEAGSPEQMFHRIQRLLRFLDTRAKKTPNGPRAHFILVVNASVGGVLVSTVFGKTLAELGGGINHLEPAKVIISNKEGKKPVLVFRGNRREISF